GRNAGKTENEEEPKRDACERGQNEKPRVVAQKFTHAVNIPRFESGPIEKQTVMLSVSRSRSQSRNDCPAERSGGFAERIRCGVEASLPPRTARVGIPRYAREDNSQSVFSHRL